MSFVVEVDSLELPGEGLTKNRNTKKQIIEQHTNQSVINRTSNSNTKDVLQEVDLLMKGIENLPDPQINQIKKG